MISIDFNLALLGIPPSLGVYSEGHYGDLYLHPPLDDMMKFNRSLETGGVSIFAICFLRVLLA